MQRLLLLRHARAGFQDGISDFNRSIKSDLPNIHLFIKNHQSVFKHVDCVICSSAIRATQTLQKILPHVLDNVHVVYSKELYNKRLDYTTIIWQILKEHAKEYKSPLVIGHNPGLSAFFNTLSCLQCEHIHFPTLGLAQIELYDANWSPNSVHNKALFG